jgi:hypothetical protein
MGVRLRMTLLAAATFALVTACGSGGGDGNKVASLSEPNKPEQQQQTGDGEGNPEEDLKKMKEYAKCMREHGVDMPDPQSQPGGGVTMELSDGDGEKVKAAEEQCRKLLPNGGAPPKLDAAQLDKLREQAKCMREHGVNMPDPDPNNPMMSIDTNGLDEEALKKAFEACGQGEGKIEVGRGGGDGPGFGVAVPAPGGAK